MACVTGGHHLRQHKSELFYGPKKFSWTVSVRISVDSVNHLIHIIVVNILNIHLTVTPLPNAELDVALFLWAYKNISCKLFLLEVWLL